MKPSGPRLSRLNDKVLSFSINALQDVLPHNVNLFHWNNKNSGSKACPLCGNNQPLMHVLNNCLLVSIVTGTHGDTIHCFKLLICLLSLSCQSHAGNMTINLPGRFYSFPPGFEDCSLHPDLVVWNSSLKQVIIFELIVPCCLLQNRAIQAPLKPISPVWVVG